MTNNDFIIGLINIGVQKGYPIPDENTNTKYVDKGIFTFLYSGDIIRLERNSNSQDKDKVYFFKTTTLHNYLINRTKNYISEETYKKAFAYFYSSDYDKLKKQLEKDIRKVKLEKIDVKNIRSTK